MGIVLIFLLILIVIGGLYITNYEQAPLFERIQIFGVGLGIYVGIILQVYG